MSRRRLLIVSGRTLNRAAMATWGQGEPLVEGGGQEPVGQCQDRTAAGAGGGQPGAVAAALVQAGLPLLVVQGHQRSGQGVPLAGLQAVSAGWQSQVGAGLVEPVEGAGGPVVVLGAQGVVPVAVPVAAGQRQGVHLPR